MPQATKPRAATTGCALEPPKSQERLSCAPKALRATTLSLSAACIPKARLHNKSKRNEKPIPGQQRVTHSPQLAVQSSEDHGQKKEKRSL